MIVACDSGYLEPGEEVISVAAGTAIVTAESGKLSPFPLFGGMEIREIPCKPRLPKSTRAPRYREPDAVQGMESDDDQCALPGAHRRVSRSAHHASRTALALLVQYLVRNSTIASGSLWLSSSAAASMAFCSLMAPPVPRACLFAHRETPAGVAPGVGKGTGGDAGSLVELAAFIVVAVQTGDIGHGELLRRFDGEGRILLSDARFRGNFAEDSSDSAVTVVSAHTVAKVPAPAWIRW